MAKYIDVEAVYCADCEYYGNCDHVTCDVKSFPAADVVEVVRCRDCVYRNNYGLCTIRACTTTDYFGRIRLTVALPDGFCSCGERRGNDG